MQQKKVVIITGGAGGMGKQLAQRFATDEWITVVADRDLSAARQVARELSHADGNAHAVQVDVTDPSLTTAMAESVVADHGRIDALINNAGLYGNPEWTGSVLDISLAEWDRVMEVNLKGALLASRAVAPVMIKQAFGRIINISSHGAYKAAGAYSISKLALNHLTWDLAKELGQHGVTVNAIGPGSMGLPNNKFFSGNEAQRSSALSSQFVNRFGNPDDIYAALKYFSSEEAGYCTGQTLLINGGANVLI